MFLINAKDYGIIPGREISEELAVLLKSLGGIQGEKTVIFEKGVYSIDSEKCIKRKLYITNTAADDEYDKDEIPHLNTVAFYLEKISDTVIDANGSVFLVDGKATNMAIIDSENLVIKNLEICHTHPDMHELKVVKRSLFYIDFEIDSDSLYEFRKGRMFFYGNGYRVPADKNADTARWIGLIRKETPDKVKRVAHPLAHSLRIRDMGNRIIRVYYPYAGRFKAGDCFYVYDVRRQFAGIFADRSKNITLQSIKQRFNYSLALVAQDSENITVDSVDFSSGEGSARKLASVADFIQLCMCRGKMTVKNSYFDGAGDDCLNVHGIHFIITDKDASKIKVRFMHPQTHGFNPLRAGDEIGFINPETMLETGRAVILESEQINETDIALRLDRAEKAQVGYAIEDITACPDLDFTGNTLTRIITRGLLITTRGRVNVEGNRFVSTTMSGILISDDAKSWYESGMCCNVSIKNNVFDCCEDTPVLIKPENRKHLGAVHRNIEIINNTFRKYNGVCIDMKSTDDVLISGNSFSESGWLKTENCRGVTEKSNSIKEFMPE